MAKPPAVGKCFADRDELLAAIKLYLVHPDGGITVQQYGHPIGKWCVSQVTSFSRAFCVTCNKDAQQFNDPLPDWNLSRALDTSYMFNGAALYNQPMALWDVSKVQSTEAM